jgi:hypothetical protein
VRTFPELRDRTNGVATQNVQAERLLDTPLPAKTPAERNVLSGAMSRILAGLFGPSDPKANSSAEVVQPKKSLFQFHEGDLFTPGTGNYALDPFQELPLQTIWGHAFLRKPDPWHPIGPVPVAFVPPGTSYVRINGIGGLVAGQMAMQPLESNGD